MTVELNENETKTNFRINFGIDFDVYNIAVIPGVS